MDICWESCDNSVMWLWKLLDVKAEVCKVEYIVSELILVTQLFGICWLMHESSVMWIMLRWRIVFRKQNMEMRQDGKQIKKNNYHMWNVLWLASV